MVTPAPWDRADRLVHQAIQGLAVHRTPVARLALADRLERRVHRSDRQELQDHHTDRRV